MTQPAITRRMAKLRGKKSAVTPHRSGAVTADDGRSRILAAAVDVFSIAGFEGASLRQIAERGDAQHQLLVYHFKTKDALWRAAIESLLTGIVGRTDRWRSIARAAGPVAGFHALLREFVVFSSERPQYHRIATFEGRSDSERLRWLLATYVRPFYVVSTELIAAAQAKGAMRAGSPGHLHYAMIGVVTTTFVFAPEYTIMTGVDPFGAREIESTIALVCELLGLASTPANES